MATKFISPMELTTLLNRSKDFVLKLTIYEHRILSFLLARVNKERLPTHGYLAWPGTEQIIEYTGISKSTIERSRTSMVKAGWMQYTPGHGAGSSNHYYINAAKIVGCYVESGFKRPEGTLYETRVQEKEKKKQERNTSGLMRGKEQPVAVPKVEPLDDNKPKMNPDGSPPFWANGERRYSYDDVIPRSNSTSATVQNNSNNFYEEPDGCPF